MFWDEARGWYIDATEPEKLPTNSQHPLALGLYFDVLEEPQKSAAIGNLLSHELIWCEYYFQQFVLKALADNGRADDAMTVVRSLWAPVVKANSYTVWEARAGRRSMGNCGSLCHAFSCAPLYFLQAVVLGIRPIKPGFEEFTLTPQLTDLGSAWGSIPTPHGLIRMKAERKDDGSTTVDVDVPEGTQAVTKKGETFGAGQHRVDLP